MLPASDELFMYNRSKSETETPPQPGNSQGVYTAGGLRLDRTPTDDEINWLWNKVRTCLYQENEEKEADIPVKESQKIIPDVMSSKVCNYTQNIFIP